MEEKKKSHAAIIAIISAVAVIAVAIVGFLLLSATSNKPIQTMNATQASLVKTGVSVEMDGLGDDLLVGPIISLKDKDGNAVVDHLEMRGSQSLPGVRAGKYDLTVDAPAIGRDGMVYECLDPIQEVIVGDDGSVAIDLGFRQVPIEEMTPEQLQRVKDELEAAGVPVEVTDVVSNTYDPTQQQQPTGEPTYQQGQPYTETWTYVETPQQPQQQQTQPQQSQPQQQAQPMQPTGTPPDYWEPENPDHVHQWIRWTQTWSIDDPGYQLWLHCNGCGLGIASDYQYSFENPNPLDIDNMKQILARHQAETGHSGSHTTYYYGTKDYIGSRVVNQCEICGATRPI